MASLILVAIAFCYLYVWNAAAKAPTDRPLAQGNKFPASSYPRSASATSPPTVITSSNPNASTSRHPIKNASDLWNELGAPPDEVILANPRPFLQKARQGDPAAANMLYQAIINCTKFGKNTDAPNYKNVVIASTSDCSNLNRSEAKGRLEILSAAAEGGDTLAQYNYGIEAKSLSIYQQSQPSLASQAVELNKTATKYLESAASQGLAEAYLALFEVYKTGIYGTYDASRAYANIQALANLSGVASYEVIAKEFGSTLNPYELSKGAQLANQLGRN